MDIKLEEKSKPKDPLLAVIFSLVLAGLGQVYAGRPRRGLACFILILCYSAVVLIQLLTPLISLKIYVAEHFKIFILLGIIFSLDSFFCAVSYNKEKNITRKKSYKRDVSLVIAILIIVFFLNPFHIFAYYSRFYLAECIKIRQDKPFFNLIKGDEVVANKFIYRISTPRRYDIGLFKNNKSLFMARIIGLPGDIIEISSGRFLVNGSEVEGLSSPKENQEFSYKQEVGPSEYFVFKDGDPAYFWKGRCLLVPASFLKGKIYKIYYPLARAKVIH